MRPLSCAAMELISWEWTQFAESGGWDWWECKECDCGQDVHSVDPDCVCPKCGLEHTFEGPMISYCWPLPYFTAAAEKTARKLAHLPVVLTHAEGCPLGEEFSYGLVLSGGGMDLSWELCEAYVSLGYIPPRKLWSLPDFSGMEINSARKKVLRAISLGIRYAQRLTVSNQEALRHTRQRLAENRLLRLRREKWEIWETCRPSWFKGSRCGRDTSNRSWNSVWVGPTDRQRSAQLWVLRA